MDKQQRENQALFLRAMIASLALEDRFALLACDVDCVDLTDGMVTAESAGTALDKLAARDSLGWTNLDVAVTAAVKAAPAGAHIIYVGDGIQATSDIDPVETAQRLKRLFTKDDSRLTTHDSLVTVHTVATGSAYEAVIMKGLGSIGGGSFREMRGARAPVTTAAELLHELTHPGLKDLSLEFHGIRTARVYPAVLPNLAAGMQQVITGRYLPSSLGKGKVTVTGLAGNKKVRFTADISLPKGETGNAFIPRLWARRHLDVLLEQGASPEIKNQIVGFSQEFKIMTPYTSFLVLESDADRERFGVKRHFKMRDGEAFFADGKDAAKYELARQQMLVAAQWRMNVRRKLLLGLKDLGREYPAPPQPTPFAFDGSEVFFSISGGMTLDHKAPTSSPGWGKGGFKMLGGARRGSLFKREDSDKDSLGFDEWNEDINGDGLVMDVEDADGDEFFAVEEREAKEIMMEVDAPIMAQYTAAPVDVAYDYAYEPNKRLASRAEAPVASLRLREKSKSRRSLSSTFIMDESRRTQGYYGPNGGQTFSPDAVNENWLARIFPTIPGALSDDPAKLPENGSGEVKELLTGLLRRDRLALKNHALKIDISDTYFQPDKADSSTTGSRRLYWSEDRWLRTARGSDDTVNTSWMTATEMGSLDHTYWTARTRDSQTGDSFAGFPELGDGGKVFPGGINSTTRVVARKTEQGIELSFKQEGSDYNHMVLVIDPKRQVLLEKRNYDAKGLTSKETFSEFAEVAGVWWPMKAVGTHRGGMVTYRRAITIETVDARTMDKALADFAKKREQAVELPQPLPKPTVARRKVADGKGAIADYASLISHAVALQKWDEIPAPEKALFDRIGDRTAKPWMRVALYIYSRRNEDARLLIEKMSAGIAESAKNTAGQSLLKPARQLVHFANSGMQVNELLKLLEILKPVYVSAEAAREWRINTIGLLQQAGRQDAALVEAEAFYADFPDDASGITTLTSLLNAQGENKRVYALLDQATGENSTLGLASRVNLCNHWISLLQNNQSERQDQVDVFERMFAISDRAGMGNEYNCRRYLSVLFSLDPEGVFKERMNQWLDLTADTEDQQIRLINLSKLQAAVNMALGNSYDGRYNLLAPEWIPDLVRIVESFAANPFYTQLVSQIMSNYRFQSTEAAAALRASFTKELLGDINQLGITQLIQRAQWVRFSPPAVEKDQWQTIINNLVTRWEKLPTESPAELSERLQLGETIVGLNQTYIGTDAAITFSRLRLTLAKEPHINDLRLKHFNLLISGDWRETYEDEAFALLDGLGENDEKTGGDTVGIHGLMLLTDWMVDSRVEAGLKEEELAGKLQKLDRKTRWLLEKQLEADARLAALESLSRHRDGLVNALRPWVDIEALDLQTRLLNTKNLPEKLPETLSSRNVVAEVREALGPQAPSIFADGRQLMLLRRRLALAEFWAAGGRGLDDSAREDLGKFLIQYCGDALKQAPKEPEGDDKGFKIAQAEWRNVLYNLLVILKQPKPLEKHLRQWAEEADGDAWRIPLAYLLTATDRLNAAILEMERAESAKLLGPADYRALAGWYQVVDNRVKHIAARRKALEQTPEHQLSNWIYQERNRSRRRDWRPDDGVPPEIDIEAIVDHFVVLFKKSQSPSNYIWQLNDIYRNTKDFRLLRCVPEGIVGMSAQQVYPMLNNLRSVMNDIRDEAVVDEFYDAIVDIREKAVTTVDARALLLLEADIMRRASEVLNQPGQHTPKALTALKAAFDKGDWGPGEPLQMAQYLANLGRISQETLAAEQRRQLKVLHEQAKPGTLESLRICMARCRVLWSYAQDDKPIALLEAELTAYRQAMDGVLIANANSAMDQLVGYCESKYQFQKAEGLLLAELGRPANRNQWRWLRQRIYRTYNGSIRFKGTTRLGAGQEQYKAACGQLVKELLSEKDLNHAQQLVSIQCDIFRSAREVKIDTVAEDIVRFAMEYFPEMAVPAQQYIYQYHNMVGQLAETVKDLASPKAGIAFLLAVAAKEPPAISHGYQSFWGQHAYRLGQWRNSTKDLGDLEKPLIDLVCRELRRQLETGQQTNSSMYHNNNSYFWGEKADVFAQVAEEVLTKHPDSGKIAFQVAHYLYEGLDRYDRAIQILAAAYERELLDENGQSYFAQCLTRQSRHAEAVPVLEHLVAWRPDALGYRTRLMAAYFGSQRPADVERCRAEADKHFRQPKFWRENVAYSLGSACRNCQLDKHAVVYLEDAIALHRKARNDRVQGDHQLSNFYYELAESYSRLGNTQKAVDAASGAIVCWSRNHDERRRSVKRLTDVLRRAKDLDAYMATVDAEAEKTGLENPVLRKAAGRAYENNGKPEKAIVQYIRALESQPNDVETHSYYTNILRKLNKKETLPEALLAWHRAAPRDLSVIQQLQQAYTVMELPEQTERAGTMLVESQPLEASAHQAMAELRQQQNRWEEAALHWRRVAELRELEPTGLLGLAKAQMHLKQTEEAQESIDKLLAKKWPERFGNVHDQARRLLR